MQLLPDGHAHKHVIEQRSCSKAGAEQGRSCLIFKPTDVKTPTRHEIQIITDECSLKIDAFVPKSRFSQQLEIVYFTLMNIQPLFLLTYS